MWVICAAVTDPQRATSAKHDSPRRFFAVLWRLTPLLAVMLFAAIQLLAHPNFHLSNDSYRYARTTLQLLGESRADAQRNALAVYCSNQTYQAQRSHEVTNPANFQAPFPYVKTYDRCIAKYPHGLLPNSPQYERIFDTRPGYPLLLLPAVAAFGLLKGMWLTSLLITAAASMLVFLLLRVAGLSRMAGLIGQGIFFASPLAYWSMQPLSEGALTVFVLVAMLGSWKLLQGKIAYGAIILLASYAALAVTKDATGLLLALSSVFVCGVALLQPRLRRRTTVLFAGISALAGALIVGASYWLRLPSAETSLQDTFTRHFTMPPATHIWTQLIHLNAAYWQHWLADQATRPMFLLLTALACWALFTRNPTLGWLGLTVGLVGVGTAIAHPVVTQTDRLWELAWIVPVLGIPAAVDHLRRRRDAVLLEGANHFSHSHHKTPPWTDEASEVTTGASQSMR